MNHQHLRKIRIVVSAIFFLTATILFLYPVVYAPRWVNTFIISLQVAPAFFKLFTGIGLSAIGILFIFLVTLGFGRLYCSSICPLGTLQDCFIAASSRKSRKRRFQYKRRNGFLHYSILGIAILTAIGGSLTVVDLLDPFSNFGRIATHLLRPVEMLMNNGIASILSATQTYILYQIPIPNPDPFVISFSVFLVVLVAFLSVRYGRLFCNLLCPVGALLRVLTSYSLYRLVIRSSDCKDCSLCEKLCKAECIDSEAGTIEFGSCVGCFDCVDACPTAAVVYERRSRQRYSIRDGVEGRGRRRVIESVGSAMVLLGASRVTGAIIPDSMKASAARKVVPVTPPGSVSVSHFSQYCTACHLCVSACPTQVITPSLVGYGIQGIFQPRLDYSVGYCKYDCNVCGEICPSGAIAAIDVEAKKEIQLGKARFVKEECIVVTKKTECGACSEHCPTKAVKMVPYEKLLLPELNNDICVGCGACEHACPTRPARAIYVESNPIHLRAKKPPIERLEKELAPQDFPF